MVQKHHNANENSNPGAHRVLWVSLTSYTTDVQNKFKETLQYDLGTGKYKVELLLKENHDLLPEFEYVETF